VVESGSNTVQTAVVVRSREGRELFRAESTATEASQRLAELKALGDLLTKLDQAFPDGDTRILAKMPGHLAGFLTANLPSLYRQGFLKEDQSQVAEFLRGQFGNPIGEPFRPAALVVAEHLAKTPLTVNWDPKEWLNA
jgi:hypothetical protein